MPVSFIGAGNFKGNWNANTNSGSADFLNTGTPLLASSASATAGYNQSGVSPALTASVGDYWQVTTAGTTNVDGETGWQLNDWCLYVSSSADGFHWQRLSVTDTVASVIVGEASESGIKNTLLASASANSGPGTPGGQSGEVLFVSASNADGSGTDKYFEGNSNFTFDPEVNLLNLTGTFRVNGEIQATQLHTNFVTSSVLYDDGDTKFGDSVDDQHQFTGSVYCSLGLTASHGISGSYLMGDGSRLTGISAGSTLGNPAYGNPASSSVPFWGAVDGGGKYGLTGSGRFNFYSSSHSLQVTGNIRATDLYVGSGIYHEGDVDNFILFGTNQLSAEIDGFTSFQMTEKNIGFNPNGDDTLDFSVSGSKTMIFVDSANDRVGISHGFPQTDFDVSGSTILGRSVAVATPSTHQISGTAEFGDTIAVGQDILHLGDANTKITFTDDQIDFAAGGVTLLTLDEAGQDIVIVGDGSDVDFQVKALNDNHAIFVQGSTDNVGIGYSAPDRKLSVSGSTTFGRPSGEGDNHQFTGSIYVSDDIYVADRISNLNDTDTFIDFGSNIIDYHAGGLRGLEHTTNLFDFDPDQEGINFRVQGTNISNTLYMASVSDNIGIRCNPSGTIQALCVSGSTLFGSASANTHEFTGSVYVSNNIAFAGNLHNAADDDTYIDFTTDRMRFFAGNIQFADYLESATGQDITTFNGGAVDVDFLVKSNGSSNTAQTHTIFVEASSARVGIAESSPSAQLDVSGSTILGRNDGDTVSYHQVSGTLELTGNVGLNTPATDYSITLPNLDSLEGRGMAYAWSTYSSARYKQNVTPLPNPIETAKKLQGVEFTWKESGHKDFGFIAEEVGKVLPQLVSYEADGKSAIGMDYSKITSLLVECVKQQQEQIDTQEDRIKQLEKKLKS